MSNTTNLLVTIVIIFVLLAGFETYAKVSISGELSMKNMEFSLQDNQIKIKIDSIKTFYTLKVNDGCTVQIFPQVKFVIIKNQNDESFLKSIHLLPKIESTGGYESEVQSSTWWSVDFQNPDQISEVNILLVEGEDYSSYPRYRVYESVSSSLINQDFYIDIVQLISKDENVLPTDFALNQNYPNPFNSSTTISFDLPDASIARLSVFNSKGQLVDVLANGYYPQGIHLIKWDASNYSTGTYYYILETDNFQSTKKCILLR